MKRQVKNFLQPKTENWQARAKCRDVDPEIFFLPYMCRSEEKRQRIAAAKKICAECPVIAECLAFAVETEEQFGVWGGTSEEERQVLIRRSRRARAV